MSIVADQLPERFRDIISEEAARFEDPKTIEDSAEIPDTQDIPIEDQRKWLRIPDVICVFVDMKGSTGLSAKHQDRVTAAAFQLFTHTAVRLFDAFEAPYIDVRGDGVFALFNEWQPYRALASAVTFKTFANEVFVPKIKSKSDVAVGSHLGIDQRTVLVRKVGMKRYEGRSDRQNEVWAGRPVNMAAKLAGRTEHNELLVSDRFFSKLADKHAITSCGCPSGTKSSLWTLEDLSWVDTFDFDKAYKLKSNWCATHGNEFCETLLTLDRP